jgi:hypothetical protein
MNVFIGLDVSLASTAICVVSAHGGKSSTKTTDISEPETFAIQEISPSCWKAV